MFIPNGVLYGWYWYINELPKLLVELAWSIPSPFGLICMLIIAAFAYAWWLFCLLPFISFESIKTIILLPIAAYAVNPLVSREINDLSFWADTCVKPAQIKY